MNKYKIISFYKFIDIDSPQSLQDRFYIFCKKSKILGTLIIANEGINGMLAGQESKIDEISEKLFELRLDRDDIKISFSEIKPFNRLRIKPKKEIISLGSPEKSNPNKLVGKHVKPKDWNQLLDKKDVILVDTRNCFETSIGTFDGALVPNINTFKEFPGFLKTLEGQKEKKIAMFCTGGIRCEKVTSYMLEVGFKKVFHLKGGIVKYLETVPESESKWEGECFVFDNRVTVEHGMKAGTYVTCNACGEPLNNKDMDSPKFNKGISCPQCYDKLTKKQIVKVTERQKQVELAKKRGGIHVGE